MRFPLFALGLGLLGACSSAPAEDGSAQGDDQNATSEATIAFTSKFESKVSGTPTAGKPLRVEYALERLPKCRGNVGGGGPGWSITGFMSENGGAAKRFDVTQLSPDGKERVTKPATVELAQGGDVAFWFQVTSVFGCTDFDSQFGQNFHFDVKGAPPAASSTIAFGVNGEPRVEGRLEAGGKARVRYEQARLPQCRRSQGGHPQWTITGFAKIDRGEPRRFDTGRPTGSDRETVEAVIDLPKSGELALWFEVTSLGGCHEFDSKGGANYTFRVD